MFACSRHDGEKSCWLYMKLSNRIFDKCVDSNLQFCLPVCILLFFHEIFFLFSSYKNPKLLLLCLHFSSMFGQVHSIDEFKWLLLGKYKNIHAGICDKVCSRFRSCFLKDFSRLQWYSGHALDVQVQVVKVKVYEFGCIQKIPK